VNAAMCSVYDDVELLEWLRWAEEHGTSFPRKLAEAAFGADLKNYNLIRPARNAGTSSIFDPRSVRVVPHCTHSPLRGSPPDSA
jgi:hypothetical protein